jgi:hypothetical protein
MYIRAIVYTKKHGRVELDTCKDILATSYLEEPLHREDGPAIEYSDGAKEWYIDDDEYSKEEFDQITKEAKSLPLELRLIDPRWWVREMK